MEELYGITPQDGAGLDTYASIQAADEGKIKTALLLGGNLFASNPDRTWAARSMRKIGTTISLTTKLNEGHLHGRGQTSIVLPVLARDEESQSTTQESMFSYVRVSEGGPPAVEGLMRSEVDLIASLAERILPEGRFDWTTLRSHAHLRAQIAAVVPGYRNPDPSRNHGGEFQIEGRTFHAPEFATPDGKAHFHVTPLAHLKPAAGEFRLMTLRSEGQFNTVVYEEDDLYRGIEGRDAVMMSAEDAGHLGVSDGSRVVVTTEAGQLGGRVAIVDIRPGNLAMYYPEANVLVPQRIDPISRTPAFKSILARVQVGHETATSSREPTQASLFDEIPGA
jgi:anaerobic selenocysteine-containing dehydrogenase